MLVPLATLPPTGRLPRPRSGLRLLMALAISGEAGFCVYGIALRNGQVATIGGHVTRSKAKIFHIGIWNIGGGSNSQCDGCSKNIFQVQCLLCVRDRAPKSFGVGARSWFLSVGRRLAKARPLPLKGLVRWLITLRRQGGTPKVIGRFVDGVMERLRIASLVVKVEDHRLR